MANGPGKKLKGFKGAISEKELDLQRLYKRALRNAGGPVGAVKVDLTNTGIRQQDRRTPSQSSSRLRKQLGMTKNPTSAGTSKFGKFQI